MKLTNQDEKELIEIANKLAEILERNGYFSNETKEIFNYDIWKLYLNVSQAHSYILFVLTYYSNKEELK